LVFDGVEVEGGGGFYELAVVVDLEPEGAVKVGGFEPVFEIGGGDLVGGDEGRGGEGEEEGFDGPELVVAGSVVAGRTGEEAGVRGDELEFGAVFVVEGEAEFDDGVLVVAFEADFVEGKRFGFGELGLGWAGGGGVGGVLLGFVLLGFEDEEEAGDDEGDEEPDFDSFKDVHGMGWVLDAGGWVVCWNCGSCDPVAL
jgi:hypothetical protein